MLTDEDDRLHPVAKQDDYWTETTWFGAHVAERGIGINLFTLFRPVLGVMKLGIYVWEPGRQELWELPYYRTFWHLPMPAQIDATDFSLPVGYAVTRLEPMRSYRLNFDDGELSLRLTFSAIHPAEPFGVSGGYGHLDQIGRVRGWMELAGERLAVDCFDMRDRTWAPRRETKQRARVAYTYGVVSETMAFHMFTKWDEIREADLMMSGFLLTPKGRVALASGHREVRRDEQGRPQGYVVAVRDDDGNEWRFSGESVSGYAFPTTPYFVWMSLVRWRFPNGATGYGQDQDTWAPARFRRFLRDRRAGKPEG